MVVSQCHPVAISDCIYIWHQSNPKIPSAIPFPIPSFSGLSARYEESCKKHTNTSLNKDDLVTSWHLSHNMGCQSFFLSWQSQKSHRHQMKSIDTLKSYKAHDLSTHFSCLPGMNETPSTSVNTDAKTRSESHLSRIKLHNYISTVEFTNQDVSEVIC